MSQSTILVVDDDVDLRDLLVESLTSAGFRAVGASNGNEAIRILKVTKIHVMISDIRMPGISGIELFTRTRQLGIPTVLISGFIDTLDLERAVAMGAADFISKPFKREELINSVEVALMSAKTELLDDNALDARFCRVNIENFLTGSRASQDVYVQLAGAKFLRIARSDSPLSMERVRSYKEKGLRYLFIKNEDFGNYVGFNLGLSKAVLSKKDKIPVDDKLRLIKLTSSLYLENLHVNGITRESYQEGCQLVETTLANVIRSDELFTMIELLRAHSDAAYTHSLAVSLYSTMLARQIGWENSGTLFKIAMAGLLIDIGEKEIPDEILKKFHNGRGSLTADEMALYETHPSRSKALLMAIDGVPEEVQIAVLQHHENMAGQGYPHRPPRMKLHAMSRILGLVGCFCELIFDRNEGRTGLSSVDALAKLYPAREIEFDPLLIRALMGVLAIPIPAKLMNLRGEFANVA